MASSGVAPGLGTSVGVVRGRGPLARIPAPRRHGTPLRAMHQFGHATGRLEGPTPPITGVLSMRHNPHVGVVGRRRSLPSRSIRRLSPPRSTPGNFPPDAGSDPSSASAEAQALLRCVEECAALEECDVGDREELHPLKEALERARRRRDEASSLRTALERRAQELGERASAAEAALKLAREELAGAEGAAAAARRAEGEASDGEDAGATREEGDVSGAEEGTSSGRDSALPPPSLPPRLPSPALVSLDASAAALLERERTMNAEQEEAEARAEEAMAAAEQAVRDEMEAVAVLESTLAALAGAVGSLRSIEDSNERRGEAWERKTQAGTESEGEREGGEGAGRAARRRGRASETAPVGDGSEARPPAFPAPEQGEGGEGSPAPPPPARQLLAASPPAAAVEPAGASRASGWAWACGGLALGALAAAAAAADPSARAALASARARVAVLARAVPLPRIHESERSLLQTIWLLLSSVVAVPLVCRLPGGSAVLGFLTGGAAIGPYALGIVKDVSSVRHVAELGVVFLLFNIGLELSFDRLRSMQKFVFGMGSCQVLASLGLGALAAWAATPPGAISGGAAVILGGGLALSSTAVAMQVLADRGETGSRHGRATFSVLLFQDLAVVVLLMLVPLLAPRPGAPQVSRLRALGGVLAAVAQAGLKAAACMGLITLAGRRLLQPLYRRVAEAKNAEIFAALTLLVVLGTSLITQMAGLSLALGAFLAGLLLAETPYHLQIEADIAPYKGLLMGLFFMTVGMEISVTLLFQRLRFVLLSMAGLLVGKVAIMAVVGRAFGQTSLQATRAGLLLAPGGEFAFVLFGEALLRGILPARLVQELYLVVALSMALTPLLAAAGARLAGALESRDVRALQPRERDAEGLKRHVIVAGWGRVGRLVAELLSVRHIPYVALDLDAAAVAEGQALDLPVYFGDAGAPAVLHALGADRASAAVATLESTAANYRAVWTLKKHFPHVKTFARARDVQHGIKLEQAGANAVVPETLEPSLQLAAAVLSEMGISEDDVSDSIRTFRRTHLSNLQALAQFGSSAAKDEAQAGAATEPAPA